MTDIQLYLAIGLPIIAVLTSLTVSMRQVSAIREEVARIHEDMRGLRSDFREDMRAIRNETNTSPAKSSRWITA